MMLPVSIQAVLTSVYSSTAWIPVLAAEPALLEAAEGGDVVHLAVVVDPHRAGA